jgi:hypothetical protein
LKKGFALSFFAVDICPWAFARAAANFPMVGD